MDLSFQIEANSGSVGISSIESVFEKIHEMLTEALNSHLLEKYCTRRKDKNSIANDV